ncbi:MULTISPECIES: redoxin family protein [unclassified Granulicatella]|uniref:redoxin family protein n=1 Tax=unclassified Granulicatella TaxID=2630493 RepID=UPI001073E10D|nr:MULTISPECIES: redoxin family protein [unclassified Granulicatella]MBF0779573.1 redoxin family protein [Granulicatella sp. 19428wC4_WM01]TFU96377.1 redoxin domain-containing protein [Granulicatella sp. WM01]
MRKTIKYTFPILLFTILGLAACQNTSDKSTTNSTVTKIEQAKSYDFSVKDMDGKGVKLSDFKGKKVYINVWASWCGPCIHEIPELEKTYQKHKDDDSLVFLSITYPNDVEFQNTLQSNETKSSILGVKERLGITYPILFDVKDDFIKNYGIRAFPTHIFINSDGTLNAQVSGMMTMDILEETLQKMK